MSRIERSYENCEIYDNSHDHWRSLSNLHVFKGLQGGPVQIYENCENYEIYENSPEHLQYQRNLFKGLQGSPIESYENCENIAQNAATHPGTFLCEPALNSKSIREKCE